MIQQAIFSDKHLQEMTEYLPYPEGGDEDLADFETLAQVVGEAVAPYLNAIGDDPAQLLVFVARAVYFLGALHGMNTYRWEVSMDDRHLRGIEEIKFSLDKYCALDFIEFMQNEVPEEFIDRICRKLGFDFGEVEVDDDE